MDAPPSLNYRNRLVAAIAAANTYAEENTLALGASEKPMWTVFMVIMAVGYTLVALVLLSYTFSWLFWTLLSMLLTSMSLFYALYQLLRINLDLGLMSLLKFANFLANLFSCKCLRIWWGGRRAKGGRREAGRRDHHHSRRLRRSHSFAEYNQALSAEGAVNEDERALVAEAAAWRADTADLPQAPLLAKTTKRLAAARGADRLQDLQFLLSGLLKRNHLGIHDEELHNQNHGTHGGGGGGGGGGGSGGGSGGSGGSGRGGGRRGEEGSFFVDWGDGSRAVSPEASAASSVASSPNSSPPGSDSEPPSSSSSHRAGGGGGGNSGGGTTKTVVEEFQREVEACLFELVDADDDALSLDEKLAFFKKERRSLGQSALCLSGGGSICMYHLGTLKALIEAGVYRHLRVVSGTSGGSIIAAMVACKTEAELVQSVIVPWISTDFTRDGQQARDGIQWFPPLREQLVNFLQDRVLVDSRAFKRCCTYYYGDMTFAEAFARTKRHVSITVTMSSDSGFGASGNARRMLLNHISSPHVTLASAVASSCALPGIMLPTSLETKDPSDGKLHKFEVDGATFVDGSLVADLPFKRMATLFNVSNFIVSQVNFHVRPFLRKAHTPNKASGYWQILSFLELDIRSRAQALAKLGLLPTFFGQNMSKVFSQKYHGDVTMVPSFTPMESMGLKAVFNPTVKDIEHYIAGGERAAWPHINRIRFMMRTEICLRECVLRLKTALLADLNGNGGGGGGGGRRMSVGSLLGDNDQDEGLAFIDGGIGGVTRRRSSGGRNRSGGSSSSNSSSGSSSSSSSSSSSLRRRSGKERGKQPRIPSTASGASGTSEDMMQGGGYFEGGQEEEEEEEEGSNVTGYYEGRDSSVTPPRASASSSSSSTSSASPTKRKLQINSLRSCVSLTRLHGGTFDALDVDDDDGTIGLSDDEAVDHGTVGRADTGDDDEDNDEDTGEEYDENGNGGGAGDGDNNSNNSNSNSNSSSSSSSNRRENAVVKQLRWEVGMLRGEIKDLGAENEHLRGMLARIGNLAEQAATSKEPTPSAPAVANDGEAT